MRAEQIKQAVTIRQAFESAGVEIDRKGFARCIFHGEKTASLKIFDKTNTFHCFGCGANGDVVKFFMLLNNIDFKAAIKEIQRTFGIGDQVDYTKQYDLRRKAGEQKLKQKKEQEEREKTFDDYLQAELEVQRLEKNKKLFQPTQETEDLHPLFTEALKKLDFAIYTAQQKLMEVTT